MSGSGPPDAKNGADATGKTMNDCSLNRLLSVDLQSNVPMR
jgi:hypothetical protein